jgi:methylenetetrahydrofolate dehydrogenase (NADP+) / methenyltetrahydrofolate cyclohydrolase
MSARVLDGKWVRDQILAELRPRVERLTKDHRPPGLAVVLVGNDPASEIYVRNKIKTCGELGIYSEKLAVPDTVSTGDLLGMIEGLNQRNEIDGILVQVPLPPQVDKHRILVSVLPDKDVDGFHPMNVGNLVANSPGPKACTPAGIMEMLLLHQNATVTICHSKTAHLAEECRRGEILVAALGKPAFLTAEFMRPGATVIDVGTNRKADGKLVGDVNPDDVKAVAGAYTPVPGGVGPLTIAMLMANTVQAAEHHLCCG